MTELVLSVPDADSLLRLVEQQLGRGMVFIPGVGGVEPLTSCSLVVVHGGRRVALQAEIVFVREEEPGRGVGLQLPPLGEETLARLRALTLPLELEATIPEFDPATAPLPALELEPLPALELEPLPALEMATESAGASPGGEPNAPATEDENAELDDDDEDALTRRAPLLHDRLRALSSGEQQRLAMTGNPAERAMLERLYGPNVWEALIASGRLSPPEVARIARKGTVPRPLLESIGANGAWLASSLVQRALLSNPRCPTTLVQRILQLLPRRELQLVPMQAAYPMAVRQAAKVMLKR